jgi:glycosyltransferase involved in cell wall biosynthesis
MRGLHAFTLPSLAEGISNTILEAMASGLPVLATAVGGNADLVEDGVTGLLVPPADADAMAQALVRLIDDPAHAAALGRAGRAAAEARFSLQAMVSAYRAVYDRGLAAAGVPVPAPSDADAVLAALRGKLVVGRRLSREERNER